MTQNIEFYISDILKGLKMTLIFLYTYPTTHTHTTHTHTTVLKTVLSKLQ